MHVVLKAPCKNDAGFTGSLVACSGLASAARQGTRSSVCVWLADMDVVRCWTGARRCSDFSADISPTSVKKERYSPFPSATPPCRRDVYIQRLWHIYRKRWSSVSRRSGRKIMKRTLYSKCCYHRRNCSSKKYTKKIFSHRKSMKTILKHFNYVLYIFELSCN